MSWTDVSKQAGDGTTFRPKLIDDMLGQERVRNILRVALQSSVIRACPMEHVLLSGPKGLGKTTLAQCIANETGGTVTETIGRAFVDVDFHSLFDTMKAGDILFIDEIHSVPLEYQELLYPVMEDFKMHVPVPGFKPVQVDLPRITIVGATTNDGMVAAPMRDRFGLALHLDFYSVEELAEIAQRDLTIFGITATPSTTTQIAMRSRGTPRLAKRFVRRLVDYATVRADGEITEAVLEECFGQLGVDDMGLDRVDHQILQTIVQSGGTASLQTLTYATGLDLATLRDKHESFLIRSGIVQVGSKGRFLTSYGNDVVSRSKSSYHMS